MFVQCGSSAIKVSIYIYIYKSRKNLEICDYPRTKYSSICYCGLCLFGRIELNSQSVGQGDWVGRRSEQKVDSMSMDDNWNWLHVCSVVQLGSGSASCVITHEFETL